jgi:ADP-ribose pyrophosphatase
METIVYNFHDEQDEFVGEMNLKSGSDAEGVQWMDIDSSLKLFASHCDFICEVTTLHNAHW